jgi:glycine C-acetyltransferase
MSDLEAQLSAARSNGARTILIATDGVFSMDGTVAPLHHIVPLARKYGAYVFVDECHATGVIGDSLRGTEEACGVSGQVDIINSTLGKALGGATGG